MRKSIKTGALMLSFLYLSCTLAANLPVASSYDSKTKGYLIENKSAYTMKLEYLDYRNKRDIAPGSKYVINTNENPLQVSWKLQKNTEPFFESLKYNYLLSKTNNKLTVYDQNTGLNGYPWTITRKADSTECIININSNVECECLIYMYITPVIKRLPLPGSITLNVKDILDKTVIFTYKHKDGYHTVNLSFPKQFKGGVYELSFTLNTNPTVKVNMVNDDKKSLTLDGSIGLANFFVGHGLMIKKNIMYIPSSYSGVFDVQSCLFDKRLLKEMKTTNAISPEFSYKINYSNQNFISIIPEYCFEVKNSQDTAVDLGNFFPDNVTFDVIKIKPDGKVYVAKNVKSWSTQDNTGEYMVKVIRPTKSMVFVKIENKKTYTLHIVAYAFIKDIYI